MEDASDLCSSKFELRYDYSNYSYWKSCVESYLQGQSLLKITKKEPSDTDKSSEEWEAKSGKALYILKTTIDKELHLQIQAAQTAKEAWDILTSLNTTKRPLLGKRRAADQGLGQGVGEFRYEQKDLLIAVSRGDLKDEKIKENPCIDSVGDTLLHFFAGMGSVTLMKRLLDIIPSEKLEDNNDAGVTPLHNAVFSRNKGMVELLVQKEPTLLFLYDASMTTPLAWAASSSGDIMKCLLKKEVQEKDLVREFDGNTILHLALQSRQLERAELILEKFSSLGGARNERGASPLHMLAATPKAFKSGFKPGGFKSFIYSCIPSKEDDSLPSPGDVENQAGMHPSARFSSLEGILPCVLHMCMPRALRSCLNWLFMVILGSKTMEGLREKKEMHLQALKLLKKLNEEAGPAVYKGWGEDPGNYSKIARKFKNGRLVKKCIRSPVMVAILNGNYDFVIETIEEFPQLMLSTDVEDGGSMLHLAVRVRELEIFKHLLRMRETVIESTDAFGNTVLHISAKLAPSQQLNTIAGAALQLQRELQWFRSIEQLTPEVLQDALNFEGKTASNVFSEEHEMLVKEGERWMKDTATSCTVVSVLIATMVFASAFQVPGGINSNGLPNLLQHTPFMVFTISIVIALSTSLTSAVMFLYILTARYAEEDFRLALPTRLILGLAVYILACFPVTIFASMQLPLFITLQGCAQVLRLVRFLRVQDLETSLKSALLYLRYICIGVREKRASYGEKHCDGASCRLLKIEIFVSCREVVPIEMMSVVDFSRFKDSETASLIGGRFPVVESTIGVGGEVGEEFVEGEGGQAFSERRRPWRIWWWPRFGGPQGAQLVLMARKQRIEATLKEKSRDKHTYSGDRDYELDITTEPSLSGVNHEKHGYL
ncbi:hypothetical protein AMTRI_Chr13g115550 [Amborella trichopoda]